MSVREWRMTWRELPAFVTALPIGIAFGAILERAGLGDARVIRGQLVLRDFTVVRVMFGAIVTAMLGLVWLAAAGVIDIDAIATPPTDLGAQALGGVIFGGGFAVAALCPGTACVAAASLRREGVATVGGVLLGTLALPALWPMLSLAALDHPIEGAHLYDSAVFSRGSIVVLVALGGVAAMRLAQRIEQGATPSWYRPTRLESVALALALAFVLVDRGTGRTPSQLATIGREIAEESDHVDALQLATWIRDARPGLRILDVRERLDDDSTLYAIPGAERVALGDVADLTIAPNEHVVLYSDGGAHAAQAWVILRARGFHNVHVLRDGLAAWEDDVLSPAMPAVSDSLTAKRFAEIRALSLWFGGRPHTAGAFEQGTTLRPTAPRRRRRTC